MKILLIYPKAFYMTPWIPIGLLNIASYLRKNKFTDVDFIDINFERYDTLLFKLSNVDIIGIGGTTIQYNSAKTIAKYIRGHSKNAVIVFGGPHFSASDQIVTCLEHGDICAIGEGEETFLEICQNKKLDDIRGIAFKKDGKVFINEDRDLISCLDDVPYPAYDLIDPGVYDDALIDGQRCFSIMTGRGCPNNCYFCASPNIWKRRVRNNSMGYIRDHIFYLIDKYHIKNLRIMDDTFSLSRDRVFEFCDMVETNRIRLNMNFLTSVNNTDLDLLKRMKSVGFSIVGLGIESGSERILKNVSKGIGIDKIKQAVANVKTAGIRVQCLFMIGNIGETEESIQDSIVLSRELQCYSAYFQFAVPYPGTRFYKDYKNHGDIITNNFDEFNPRKVVFVPKGLTKEKMEMYMDIAMRRI